MREARDRRDPALGDEVIDEVARGLMEHQPAVGFGWRAVARINEVAPSQASTRVLLAAGRVVAVGVALVVVIGSWQARQRWAVPDPSPPQVAVTAPAGTVTPPEPAASGAPPSAPAASLRATPVRPARLASRTDRLWASRAAPEVERVVVAPVPRPDPVTVQPLEVPRMALDDLAIEPLAVDALNLDRPILPQ